MVRAILKNGEIKPLTPLPGHWRDGQELVVEQPGLMDEDHGEVEDWGNWIEEVQQLAAQVPPEAWKALDETLNQQRLEQKEIMRRKMGLEK